LGYPALSLLPDLDVVGFRLGVRYAEVWGHRGAAHSLLFALGVALLFSLAYSLSERRPRFTTVLFLAFLAVGSHGLLDALTDGGLGAELLWPFSHRRFFAPFTPIPVAPIGRRMLSMRGLSIVLFEAELFLPLWLYALWPRPAVSRRS
jgi:inner membrane protein